MPHKHCTRCGCTFTLQTWSSLHSLGYQSKGLDMAGELLEIRLCTCGTSLAFDMGELPDALWLADAPPLSRRHGAVANNPPLPQ